MNLPLLEKFGQATSPSIQVSEVFLKYFMCQVYQLIHCWLSLLRCEIIEEHH